MEDELSIPFIVGQLVEYVLENQLAIVFGDQRLEQRQSLLDKHSLWENRLRRKLPSALLSLNNPWKRFRQGLSQSRLKRNKK